MGTLNLEYIVSGVVVIILSNIIVNLIFFHMQKRSVFNTEWRDKLDAVIKDVNDIKLFLSLRFPEAAFLQKQSPAALTESGKQLTDTVGADAIADKYADQAAVPENPNACQMQRACFAFAEQDLLGKLDTETKDKIETEAYEQGIEVDSILRLIGVVLRDRLLSEYGMNPKQADERDARPANTGRSSVTASLCYGQTGNKPATKSRGEIADRLAKPNR